MGTNSNTPEEQPSGSTRSHLKPDLNSVASQEIAEGESFEFAIEKGAPVGQGGPRTRGDACSAS